MVKIATLNLSKGFIGWYILILLLFSTLSYIIWACDGNFVLWAIMAHPIIVMFSYTICSYRYNVFVRGSLIFGLPLLLSQIIIDGVLLSINLGNLFLSGLSVFAFFILSMSFFGVLIGYVVSKLMTHPRFHERIQFEDNALYFNLGENEDQNSANLYLFREMLRRLTSYSLLERSAKRFFVYKKFNPFSAKKIFISYDVKLGKIAVFPFIHDGSYFESYQKNIPLLKSIANNIMRLNTASKGELTLTDDFKIYAKPSKLLKLIKEMKLSDIRFRDVAAVVIFVILVVLFSLILFVPNLLPESLDININNILIYLIFPIIGILIANAFYDWVKKKIITKKLKKSEKTKNQQVKSKKK